MSEDLSEMAEESFSESSDLESEVSEDTDEQSQDLDEIDLFVFDVDYTLADITEASVAAFEAVMEKYGRYNPLAEAEFEEEIARKTNKTEQSKLFREMGVEEQDLDWAVKQYCSEYQNFAELIDVYDGVIDFIDYALREGKEIAVQSNNYRRPVLTVLERVVDEYNSTFQTNESVSSIFSRILSCDDVRVKPDPEGILDILWGLGVKPSRSIFVGDQPFDIEAGTRAGISTVLLRTNYGEPKLGGLKPNYTFNDMSHLVSHVDSQQQMKTRYKLPVFEANAIAA